MEKEEKKEEQLEEVETEKEEKEEEKEEEVSKEDRKEAREEKKENKKEWEREIRQKIFDNRHYSEYLAEYDATDENKYSIKNVLCKMTAILDIAKQEKNSNLRSLIILGACFLIGAIMYLSKSNQVLGYILMGGASAWKFFTWGDDVDKYNEQTGNVSYTARTDMFGQVKIEKNSGNVGCIMAIIGLALGFIVTPILIILSAVKFVKSNKAFTFAKEIVEELENNLKVRYTWNKKSSKWEEQVL